MLATGPVVVDRRTSERRSTPTPNVRCRRLARTVVGKLLAVLIAAAAATLSLVVAGSLSDSWGLIPVLTGSMRPGIQPGDLLLVTPEPLGAVRVRQVLDFQPPGEGGASVVHRVVSVTASPAGPVIRTKGDANNVADAWHARLGGTRAWRVRAVIPKLGYLAVAEYNPIGRLAVELALLVGGVAVALSVVWRRPREDGDGRAAPDVALG